MAWTLNIQTLQMRNIGLSVALAVAASAVPAIAQSVVSPVPAQAPATQPIAPSVTRPPLARQILPMVEPVRRIKPGTLVAAPSTPKPAAPVATRSPVTPAVAPPLASATSNVAAPVATRSPVTPAVAPPLVSATSNVATPVATAKTRAAAAKTIHAATAANIKAAPAARPKFVAYTCRLGQDYSLERQACVPATNQRPATASITATSRKVARAKLPNVPFDATDRSALGAKPKLP